MTQTNEDESVIDAAITASAKLAGATEPDIIPRLVDRDYLAMSASGEVLGTEAAVARLKTARPGLFTRRAVDRPSTIAPASMEGRALNLINEFAFLFDPSVDLAALAVEMKDLGGMAERARSTLINRMTTACHWSARYAGGPAGATGLGRPGGEGRHDHKAKPPATRRGPGHARQERRLAAIWPLTASRHGPLARWLHKGRRAFSPRS